MIVVLLICVNSPLQGYAEISLILSTRILPAIAMPAISVHVGAERTCQLLKEEELAGDGGDEGGGDMDVGTVVEGGEEAHTLPAHTSAESTVRTADNIVCLEEETGAYGVCAAGNESRS